MNRIRSSLAFALLLLAAALAVAALLCRPGAR
jgi:hypothetical protein